MSKKHELRKERLPMDNNQPRTMNIRDYAKLWGIGHDSLRQIIDENPDFPVIRINNKTTKRKAKVLVIVEDADQWIKRNLR